jgi:hypothetical protein
MTREEFMDIVYSELYSDDDNYRANRIIDAADEYAEDSRSEKPNYTDAEIQKMQDLEFAEIQKAYEIGKAENPNKWIPVSERLPEDKTAVLVWCPQYKNIYCAYLEKEQWWIFGAFVQIVPNEVVAWMPLPEPYNASPTGAESEG